MFIPAYAVIRAVVGVVKHIYRQKDVMCAVRECEITAFGITLSARGFVDTGNAIFDEDSLVIFITKDLAMRFFSGKIKDIKFKKLTVGTVNGKAEKMAFKIETIKIYNGTTVNIHNNVTACIVNDIGEGYSVILHPALIRGNCYEVDREIKNAKQNVLKCLGSANHEVIFTSCGSESDNLAIFGSVKRGTFVTSKGEHSAVYKSFLELKNRGHKVEFIDLNSDGTVNVDKLYAFVKENSVDFVSCVILCAAVVIMPFTRTARATHIPHTITERRLADVIKLFNFKF
jgi:hypothetical protein